MSAQPQNLHTRPVTIVTGALGAGKTTLVNGVLDAAKPMRVGVIVNEFGDIGIDGLLLSEGASSMLELTSGCACCSVRGELDIALARMARSGVDEIVVETTGVADPGPVIESVAHRSDLLDLDAVVCVVDCRNFLAQLDARGGRDIAQQVELASTVALSKADLVEPARLTALRKRIVGLNPNAEIHIADHGRVPLGAVIGANAFAAERLWSDKLEASVTGERPVVVHGDGCEHGEHHHHGGDGQEKHHHDDHAHHHDHDGVQSIAATLDGELDLDRLTEWLHMTVIFKGPDLNRIKGILAIADQPNRVLVHGVRDYIEIAPGPAWNSAPRRSTIVAIGHDLNQTVWQRALEGCRIGAS